jgi:CRP/FNR family transcriptional regulator, nitrogen fixation regulation protein
VAVNWDMKDEDRAELLDAVEALATTHQYRRGQEIYAADTPAEHWYRMVRGSARKCDAWPDGRRQIVDFLLPGDFFGLVVRHQHRFTVEAIEDGTVIARYPRRKIERLVDFDPRIGRRIREAAFEASSRLQARMVILGRMSAIEKVGAFLIEMAERTRGPMLDELEVSMSRYDIADYLGLAAETVSRTLSDLRQNGAIRFEGMHRIRILDRAALTEGAPEDDWSEDRRRGRRLDPWTAVLPSQHPPAAAGLHPAGQAVASGALRSNDR